MAGNEIARLYVTVDANTKPFDQGLLGVDKRARKTTGSLKRLAAVTGGGFLGIKALSEIKDFDKGMRNVNSIAQLSEARFKKLSKSVLDLAGKTAQAPKTLAQGLYDLESSGFKANESLLILKSTAKAASAGLTDTATSTKAVAAVLNAYHLKASAAAQVSDDLFQTVNLGVLSFEDLAQNIGDVLPFATTLGVSLKDLGAATSTLTKQGVPASETMTRIKGAMVALIKPTDDMQKVLKALGVATGEELIKKAGSLQGALQAISTKVGGSKEALAKLFPDVRGLGGAFGLTGKNAAQANKDMEGFKNTAGATDKVLKEQKKSLDYQWRQFKSELAAVVDEYGTKLIPVFNEGLKVIKKMAPLIIATAGAWAVFKTAALTELAIVKAAELGLFGGPMKAKLAAEAAVTGRTVGKTFAARAGLVAGTAILGWEIGKWLRKHSTEVRDAGDFLGNTLGKAFYSKAGQWAQKIALGILSPLGFAVKATGVFKGAGKVGSVNDLGATIKGIGNNFKPGSAKANAATIVAVGRKMGASDKQILAALEAGVVESGLRNLAGGDRDSVGVFQQRPSQGWTGLRNVPKAAREFFQHAKRADRSGLSAGQLAQAVQRSAFPGRYDQAKSKALGYLGGGLNLAPVGLGGGTKGKSKTALEKMSLDSAIHWLKKNYPDVGFLLEDAGKQNQHLHVNSANHKQIRSIARALNAMGFSVGEYGGKPIPGVGGITTLRHKRYGAADHYHGGALDVNADTELVRAFGIKARGKKKGDNTFRAPAIKQSDILGFIDQRVEHFDLMFQAGLISATKAALQKRKAIKASLPGLTGDNRLKALIMLRGLPKVPKMLTAVQKTWSGRGGGRDSLALAYGALNPEWLKNYSALKPGFANYAANLNKGQPVDTTLSNPWLVAALSKQDLLAGAGQITPEQANALKVGILKNALPGLTGDEGLKAQGMIGDMTAKPDSFRSVLEQTIGNFGLSARAGDITSAEATRRSIDAITANLGNPDLNEQDRLELRAALGDLTKSIEELSDNTQQQIDTLKEQNAELKKLYNVSQAEEKVLGRAITNTVSNALGARVSLSRKTPLRGGSLGVAY